MYTIAGFDIYASWVAVWVIASIIITIINYFGAKSAAKLQTILTISIAAIGVALVEASGFQEILKIQSFYLLIELEVY